MKTRHAGSASVLYGRSQNSTKNRKMWPHKAPPLNWSSPTFVLVITSWTSNVMQKKLSGSYQGILLQDFMTLCIPFVLVNFALFFWFFWQATANMRAQLSMHNMQFCARTCFLGFQKQNSKFRPLTNCTHKEQNCTPWQPNYSDKVCLNHTKMAITSAVYEGRWLVFLPGVFVVVAVFAK